MKDKLLEQTRHEYTPKQRIILLLFIAPVFLFILPLLFIRLGARIDQWLQWTPILSPPINIILGCLLILLGFSFGIWSNYSQFNIGRGTPVPVPKKSCKETGVVVYSWKC